MGRHLSNLPAEVTSFVGRRQELREVKRLLSTTRLLTLTGSGGVGKTKLALRAATDMSRGFPDGVWLVLLGSIGDPLRVTQAVFSALGVHDLSAGLSLSSLTDYLAGKRLVLLLDNCEHLLDGCAVLASTLTTSCPDLHVLATSRQALGVAGEVRMVVPPMSLPAEAGDTSVPQLLGCDAVWLLMSKRSGELWVRGFMLTFLAQASWLRGEKQRAEVLAREAVACKHAIDDRNGLTIALGTLAWMAAECSQHERAATLLGSAQGVCDESSLTLLDLFRPQHERSVSLITRGIGRRALDAAFTRGRAMTIGEGVAFAVEDKQLHKPMSAVKAVSDTELTRRQLEIARLIADGLTNRQIADRLFLSERTVETHITNILNKLGLNSRIQLSRWIAELPETSWS